MTGYIVVIEIKKIGFVSRIYNDFAQAEREMNSTFSLTNHFEFGQWRDIIDCLSGCKAYSKYNINGNQVYVGKSKTSISNGDVTASVLKVDSQEFNLKMFIKERENHSNVFNDFSPEFLDRFPRIDTEAN
ncbi:MAG: hypothetical protein Q7W45_12350 [Bacteroidota bacterium]|nr:hypothetical protein [Bacteroidota bacterium]MDP3146881.1 hypothetical protein [Bacteroidota bacterium]